METNRQTWMSIRTPGSFAPILQLQPGSPGEQPWSPKTGLSEGVTFTKMIRLSEQRDCRSPRL